MRFNFCITMIACLLVLSGTICCWADGDTPAKSSSKKCVSDVLKGCSENDKRTSQALSKLMGDIKDAMASDDQAKMKATLQNVNDSLKQMAADHEKSAAALKSVHHRMEALKKQIKTARKEHDDASKMLDDEDMDDVIWAY